MDTLLRELSESTDSMLADCSEDDVTCICNKILSDLSPLRASVRSKEREAAARLINVTDEVGPENAILLEGKARRHGYGERHGSIMIRANLDVSDGGYEVVED